jgi:Flp pilus assembly protein TadD
VPGAWLAAALFGLHPVQVESVAWVSELKNVLSLFFSLLSLHAWVSYLDEGPGKFRRWDWIAFACYLPALLSKTTACTLPAALLLLCWLRGRQINLHRLLEMVPFVLAGIAMGLISMWWEAVLGGTTGNTFAISWPARFLIASHALWFYLSKIVWPFHLVAVYPRWQINPLPPSAWLWLAATLAATALIFFLRRRNITAAMLFFVATLSPLLGFLMLYTFRYTFVSDHWQYVACIGPLALIASGIAILFRRIPASITAVLTLLLLATLGTLTFQQSRIYQNSETLWSATLQDNPNCSIAHLNLGFALAQRGDAQQAAIHYREAIEIDPVNPEAFEDLGTVELRNGNLDDALKDFRIALALRPDFADAYSDLGTVWMQKGQLDMAAYCLKLSLELVPYSAIAHFNLGNIRARQGRTQDAIAEYQEAVRLNSATVDAWNNLAGLLLKTGRLDEAAECLQKVAALEPNTPEAHSNLGNLFLRQGHEAAAAAEFDKAAELGPNLFQVWNNLAWVLATTRDASLRNDAKAVEFATRADQLSGGSNTTVLNTLAVAYARSGAFPRAAAAARRAQKAAADQGNSSLAEQFSKRADLYESGRSPE